MTTDISAERFLPVPVILDRTSWSRAKLYDAIKKGEFVRPVRISANRIGFPESAVNAWFVSKMEAA
ncbi:MAG: AlpA family phage regulatory protein [Pseudomonadota bacterium]